MNKKGDLKWVFMGFIFLIIMSLSVIAANITLISPNGGEIYKQEKIPISWTSSYDSNETASVRLFYDLDNSSTNGRYLIKSDLQPNGTYNWSVLGIPEGDYYISADVITSNFKLGRDYSDNTFKRLHFNKSFNSTIYNVTVINISVPSLEVINPKNDSIVRDKYIINISLDNKDVDIYYRIFLDYIYNNQSYPITTFMVGDADYCDYGSKINCSYVWDTSNPILDDGSYKLNVSLSDGYSYNSTYSEMFNISNHPVLDIIYPTNHENINYDNFSIKWNTSDVLNFSIPYVDIYLDPDKNQTTKNNIPIIMNYPNNGTFRWKVPISFPDGSYYVYMEAKSYGNNSLNQPIIQNISSEGNNNFYLNNSRSYFYTSNLYDVNVKANNKPKLNISTPIVTVYRDYVDINFSIYDADNDGVTLSIYNTSSILTNGSFLLDNIDFLDICNNETPYTNTTKDCNFRWNTSYLNIPNQYIKIYLNDSIYVTYNLSDNFSIDTYPNITDVNTSNITTSSVSVFWNTNELSNSEIFYGENITNLSHHYVDNNNLTFHNISLTNILGNRFYYFIVRSCDTDFTSDCSNSSIYNFTIFNNKPIINITYPNNGENISIRYLTILWNASDYDGDNITSVDIYYDLDNTSANGRTLISSGEINDGNYTWDLFGKSVGQYYISIDAFSLDNLNNSIIYTTKYTDKPFNRKDIFVQYSSNSYDVQVKRNNIPNIDIVKPTIDELIDDEVYNITFNVSDDDNDPLLISIYYSDPYSPNSTNLIVKDIDILNSSVCDLAEIYNVTYVRTCHFKWNTGLVEDGNYSLFIESNDSVNLNNTSLNNFIINNGPDDFNIFAKAIFQTIGEVSWNTSKNTNSSIYYGSNCSVILTNYTLLKISEDINSPTSEGWSNEELTYNDGTLVHGIWGNSPNEVNKEYNTNISHDGVMVSSTYYSIDSWDSEWGYLYLDGTKVWEKQRAPVSGWTEYLEGPSNYGLRYKSDFNMTYPHTSDKLLVSYRTSIDQGESDEAWAFKTELYLNVSPGTYDCRYFNDIDPKYITITDKKTKNDIVYKTNHSVLLTNLLPNNYYFTYVKSCDKLNYCKTSKLDKFITNVESPYNYTQLNVSVLYPNNVSIGSFSYVNWSAVDMAGDEIRINIYYDDDDNILNGRKTLESGLINNGSKYVDFRGIPEGDYYILVEAYKINLSTNETVYYDKYSDKISLVKTFKTYTSNKYNVTVKINHFPNVTIQRPEENMTYSTSTPLNFNVSDDDNDNLLITGMFYYGDTYKRVFNLSNPYGTKPLVDYPVRITLDTKSLILNHKLDIDGRKLVIFNSTGEIPYYIRPNTFNTNHTEIWFEVNLKPSEVKNYEVRYGLTNRLHKAYSEPNWSHFDFHPENVILNKNVFAVTEDLPDHPATKSNDDENSTFWRGTNTVVGIPGHDNSIEWIRYDLGNSYFVAKSENVLTGTGVGNTLYFYSTDDNQINLLLNKTYTNGQTSAIDYFMPESTKYIYVDIRSLVVNPEFSEIRLYEPVLVEPLMHSETMMDGRIISSEQSYLKICTDDDFKSKTDNNCSYEFNSSLIDGTYHVCINVSDYLLNKIECSAKFTILNYEDSPFQIKDIENKTFVNIFNKTYTFDDYFIDPDNQNLSYKPYYYMRNILCHFENKSCLDKFDNEILNLNITNPNTSFVNKGMFGNGLEIINSSLMYNIGELMNETIIEMWLNVSNITKPQTVLDILNDESNETLFRISVNDSKIVYQYINSVLSDELTYNLTNHTDKLFHISAIYSYNPELNSTYANLSLFINSNKVEDKLVLPYNHNGNYIMSVGNSNSSDSLFEGLIDELRISNNYEEYIQNLNYSYINEYPPVDFIINYQNSTVTVTSLNTFRGLWNTKLRAKDPTNRSAISNKFSLMIYLPANYTEYSGNTTDYNYEDNIKNISNPILENDYGTIRWYENIDAEGINFNRLVNISNNFVKVKSRNVSTLNKSALIKLYNLSINRIPTLLIDKQDNGNFTQCPLNICQLIDYNISSGELTFNVTEFTSYKAQSNYPPELNIPDYQYIINTTPSIINLWNYTTDENITNLSYVIISQSNMSLTNCSLQNNHTINCSKPADNTTGSTLLNVSVNDSEFITYDQFKIEFGYNLTKYTFVKSNNDLNNTLNVLMKVQYYNASNQWYDVDEIYYSKMNIEGNKIIDLANEWNLKKWNTSNAYSPYGLYRAYISVLDFNNNSIIGLDGKPIEDYYNFTVYDSLNPEIHMVSPLNNTHFSNNPLVTLRCNISDNWIKNISVFVWNSSNNLIYENSTNLTGVFNETSWNFSIPYDGRYNWSCTGSDVNGNTGHSKEGNFSFDYIGDTIAPNLTIITPLNGTILNGNTTNLTFNVMDNNSTNVSCRIYVDNVLNYTINSSGVISSFKHFTQGIHNWNVSCRDDYNNTNESSLIEFAFGCSINETLCIDGTCSEECNVTDTGDKGCINSNGICEFGEGCNCSDCINQSTMCDGDSICNNEGQNCIKKPTCGDGIIDQGEECDLFNLGGKSCSSYGYSSGTLSCNLSCNIVTSNCKNNNGGGGGGHTCNPSKCNDYNPCTIDFCENNSCVNKPLDCDDHNSCTTDSCSSGSCIHKAKVCNDLDPCTTDSCSSGSCIFKPKCNDDETCNNGICSTKEEPKKDPEVEKKSKKKKHGIACENETEFLDTKYSTISKITVEKGRIMVVSPMTLSCDKGNEDMTFIISDKYHKEKAFLCRQGECNEIKSKKVSGVKCRDDIIKLYRRGTSIYTPDISQKNGGDKLYDVVVDVEKLPVKIDLLKTSIEEPENDFVRIVQNPVVIEPGRVGIFNLTMRYEKTPLIDEGSLTLFIYTGNEWIPYNTNIDYEHRTVNAVFEKYGPYMNNGTLTIALIGNICENCTTTTLKKVNSVDSRNALIMVHGFGASPASFQSLINDLSMSDEDIDLWTLSYPSFKSLDDISSEFDDLLSSNMGRYDKIVLVGHSLGGIIIQDTLNKSTKDYVKKIDTIVLMGSPNKGVSFADKFIKNLKGIINFNSNNILFNFNSKLLKDIGIPREYERKNFIKYYVIAGVKPYEIGIGKYKLYSDKIFGFKTKNDGVITIDSAKDVGGESYFKKCENYWEIESTHSDLEDSYASRKIIKNLVHNNLQTGGKGDVSYYHVSIDPCMRGDIIYVTAELNKDYDGKPLECSFDRFSKRPWFSSIVRLFLFLILLILLILLIIFTSSSIKEYVNHKHKKEINDIIRSLDKGDSTIDIDSSEFDDVLNYLDKRMNKIEKRIKKIK